MVLLYEKKGQLKMLKRLANIFLHISMVNELVFFYAKQRQWALLPGLILWSLLPLTLLLIAIGLLLVTGGLLAHLFGLQ
jgi:fatty acid desaturase